MRLKRLVLGSNEYGHGSMGYGGGVGDIGRSRHSWFAIRYVVLPIQGRLQTGREDNEALGYGHELEERTSLLPKTIETIVVVLAKSWGLAGGAGVSQRPGTKTGGVPLLVGTGKPGPHFPSSDTLRSQLDGETGSQANDAQVISWQRPEQKQWASCRARL